MIFSERKAGFTALVPPVILQELTKGGAELRTVNETEIKFSPRMWRFLVADDPDVDIFLQRDCDGHLTKRDSIVVNAWLKTGSPFHCIRDHPSQEFAINAGMWGARRAEFHKLLNYHSFQAMMKHFEVNSTETFADTYFLNGEIWPRVKDVAYCHDSVLCDQFPRSFPFPVARGADYEHIGQVSDGNGIARERDIIKMQKELKKWGVNEKCLNLSSVKSTR